MGVDSVVYHGPEDVGQTQANGGGGQLIGGKRIDAERVAGQDDAAREGEAEDELRVVGEALAEGVEGEESRHPGNVNHTRPRGRKGGGGKGHTDSQLGRREEVRLACRDGTAGDRPVPAPGHLAVKFLVHVVVPSARVAAQDDTPEQVGAGVARELCRFHHVLGHACREGQALQVWHVEGVEAGGTVQPHELCIG